MPDQQPTVESFRPDQPPLTRDYIPLVYQSNWNYMIKSPPFTLLTVSNMLADFRLRWGLWMIKGPILCKSKFFVKTDNAEVKEFLIKNITRFWRTSVMKALKAVEWGYSCSEALYTFRNGQIYFDNLKDLHSIDCRCKTINGMVIAGTVNRTQGSAPRSRLTLWGPRKFWHIHTREFHPYYGQSRLFGAYLPWIAIWSDGGYRDALRLYMHKYAFDGGGLYHPPGSTPMQDDGTGFARMVPWRDIARDLLEKKKNGGTLALPSTTDSQGKRVWEIIPTTINPMPENLVQWGEILKDEMWEGIGIPPEIASAQGTGSYNGRMVPLMGYYAILQELVYWLIHDADEQLFRPLVDFNFGPGQEYEIIPFSLLDAIGDANSPDGQAEDMQLPPQQQQRSNGQGSANGSPNGAPVGATAMAQDFLNQTPGLNTPSIFSDLRHLNRFSRRRMDDVTFASMLNYADQRARAFWTPNQMVF